MYTEGFDELSEAENRPSRTYVSTGGQDSLKLQRENERLRKSLEKEQFFNRLLDQELKDLKISLQAGIDNQQQYNDRSRGVSRASFNVLLVITLLLAGFAAYTLFSDGKTDSRLPAAGGPGTAAATPAPITDSVPTIIAGKKSSLPPFAGKQNTEASSKASVVERSAPSANKLAVKPAPVAASTTKEATPKANTPAPVQQPAAAATTNQAQPAETATTTAATTPPPTPAPTQPVVTAPVERAIVGKYMVSSKANFYSAPDENTLRSYFISPGSDKVVNALEDKNGFIYVEFKNDVGYVTKGWLSKADLTKQ